MRFSFKRLISGIGIVFFSLSILFLDIGGAQQKIYDDLFSASFPSEKEGWVAGRWGCMLHTADGGKTWTRQNTGTDLTLSSVFFADPRNGWAVGEEGIIIHTRDGGKTWEKQKSPVSFFLMGVCFVTPLKGWAVGEQSHILFTNDGGKTWIVQFKDVDVILKSISFCDPLHGWAVGEYGFIYHTRDGGAKWEKQAGKVELSETTGEVEGGTFLFDVEAIDPRTAWAVGIDSYVIHTQDGGRSWKEIILPGISKTQFFSVDSDKRGKILIGGNGIFLSSNDRGRTWQAPEFTPPVTYTWIYGIAGRGSSDHIAVGAGGAIYMEAASSAAKGKSPSNSWRRVVY